MVCVVFIFGEEKKNKEKGFVRLTTIGSSRSFSSKIFFILKKRFKMNPSASALRAP